MIPIEHPIIKRDNGYIQIPNFSEHITYTEPKVFKGSKYMVVGFDTAHGYNDETYDFNWVLSKTLEMQEAIENYKK